ncbi:uncharacterized protein [Montipora capricornis]|uniref:uncharacterized protein n=1 Tax=Montipora capricornis TaxID=246305 RepID=UPI0035F15A54
MVFSVKQLQEKCREQRKPLYLAFIDLTKAFDLVSREGLFALLQRIGCPPKLLSMIVSFHQDMRGTVQFDGSCSEPFPIKNGVKQGCVLAPTLFGIFFSLLLSYAFRDSEDGIFIHTRSDGGLFNMSRLRAKAKVQKVLIRELLFADDAGIAAHSEAALQRLIDSFAAACTEFGLTISLKKTQVMGQDVSNDPSISIGDHTLEVVDKFTYLGSTISSNLSLDAELNTRIGKAATALARLTKRVWDNTMLSTNTKMRVYQACVLSTLLYGSEAWTLYSYQERRLNAFHMRCLRRLLGITWQDRVTNIDVLAKAGMPSIFAILTQRRLRWLGHVTRMDDGRIPKDMLFGELATGTRPTGRPALRYKDVCKRDLKAGGFNPSDLESAASNRSGWRSTTQAVIKEAEESNPLGRETPSQGAAATVSPIPDRKTGAGLYLQQMQQAMRVPHRPLQPHPALQHKVTSLGAVYHGLSRSTEPSSSVFIIILSLCCVPNYRQLNTSTHHRQLALILALLLALQQYFATT